MNLKQRREDQYHSHVYTMNDTEACSQLANLSIKTMNGGKQPTLLCPKVSKATFQYL